MKINRREFMALGSGALLAAPLYSRATGTCRPSRCLSPQTTPDLAAAARKTLELRGDGGTGWSKAWKINFWARLHDGDRAHKMLGELLGAASCPTCSTRLRRSRPTATSGPRRGSPRCSSRVIAARSTCCPRCLQVEPDAGASGYVRTCAPRSSDAGSARARGAFAFALGGFGEKSAEAVLSLNNARSRSSSALSSVTVAAWAGSA